MRENKNGPEAIRASDTPYAVEVEFWKKFTFGALVVKVQNSLFGDGSHSGSDF